MDRAIHLCIDMQDWEMARLEPDAARRFMRSVTDTTAALASHGIPTLYVGYTDSKYIRKPAPEVFGAFSMVQQALFERSEDAVISLAPLPPALAATKHDISAMKAPLIAKHVLGGYQRVIISGACEADTREIGQYCATMSAIDFRQAGRAVTLVAEATDIGYKADALPLTVAQRAALHAPYGVGVKPLREILNRLAM